MTDYEISKSFKLKKINEIARYLGLEEAQIKLYGNYIAKIDMHSLSNLCDRKQGKLIFISSINPTPHGEGKTTTTIGLNDTLNSLGFRSVAVIREPSLGPLFGVKGGATGGGYAQAAPIEEINLHFTGDIPAVESANNLLSALIDNHIFHGNDLRIDPQKITFRRVIDMNDRTLRRIITYPKEGVEIETGFDITASSEVMAILCLSKNIQDLKERLSNILVGYSFDGKPIFASYLKAQGAMSLILKNAINPNLVQSLEGNPILIHGGPFANIAHGSSSIISIKTALCLADFVITEGGFGTELGGEKFIDIVSRVGGFAPSVVVIVVSLRALRHHGEGYVSKGVENLGKHIANIKYFGIPVVVALNKFQDDDINEIRIVEEYVIKNNARFAISDVWLKGSSGGTSLAKEILEIIGDGTYNIKFLYDLEEPLMHKIEKIAKTMYGAETVSYSEKAMNDINLIEKHGFDKFYVSIAKTQLSISDDPKKIGLPKRFVLNIKGINILSGARLLVPLSSKIITMPGLPEVPNATNFDIGENGKIRGF